MSSESLAVYKILESFLGTVEQDTQGNRVAQLEDRIIRLEQLVDSMAVDIYGDSTP